MSTKSLSHSPPGSPENGHLDQLEEQQSRLLAVLRRAGGAPVSYAQLREAGVEFPASVVSELELVGVEFDHCYLGEARGVVGVRLDPARDPGRLPASTDRGGGHAEQRPPAEPEQRTATQRPRIPMALLVAYDALLVWVANAARETRRATRGAIRALPAAGLPPADRLNGRALTDRLNGRPLAHRLNLRPLAARLNLRSLADRLNTRPLADRLHGRPRAPLGLGAMVLALAVFAAVGLTAGGGRVHRARAHHRQPRALSAGAASLPSRPAVRHPHSSQATTSGTGETTSSCLACQSVSQVRSLPSVPRSPRRGKASPPASHHSRPAPQVTTRPAPPRPRTPTQRLPVGHHHSSTTTPSDQASTTGGVGSASGT